MDKKKPPEHHPAAASNDSANPTTKQPPIVTGQLAEVLSILFKRKQALRLELTQEHGIVEAPARIHELRDLGFNIATITEQEIVYRGRVHRRVARYVLGNPPWPRPGFFADGEGDAA